MASVTLKNVKKVYDGGVVAVQEFSLEIADKEFIVLVGPSGCGKSTTLRMIAGLEEISSGQLYIGDDLVNDIAPKDRDIAMVFQNYALYPHMTVFNNMAYALKLRRKSKAEIREKVHEAAAILGITDLLERKPKALSGGQRQRVAIGRAIVRHPQVFLMDEPLSNLDAKLRNQMRAELIKLRERIDTTFVYVTHDQVEAMTLGDRIVIMKDGFIQQIGTPQTVFNEPANLFVAGFIGTPQMNFLPAALAARPDGACAVSVLGREIVLPEARARLLARTQPLPAKATLGIRPEHVRMAPEGGESAFSARLDVAELMGSEVHMHLDADGHALVARVQTTDIPDGAVPPLHKARRAAFDLPAAHIHLFDTESGRSLFFPPDA